MHHVLFTHSSVDGHLGCIRVLTVVNLAAWNTEVHGSFQMTVFSGYAPRSGLAGSCGNSRFSFFRNTALRDPAPALLCHPSLFLRTAAQGHVAAQKDTCAGPGQARGWDFTALSV